MKIVFNGLQFMKYNSGIGKMIEELFCTMINKKEYESLVILPKDAENFNFSANVVTVPYKNSQGLRRNFYQTFFMGNKFCDNSILITIDSKVPLIMPKTAKVLPIVTDLAVYEMPSVYKFSRVLLWRFQYKYLKKHAEKFIAVSEYTKNDLIKFLAIDKDKIEVVHCAANDNIKQENNTILLKEAKNKYNLPDKYILFIGNLNPRKNLLRLYQAFKEVKKKLNIPHKLVIAGNYGWKYKRVLKQLQSDKEILFTGYVEEPDKAALYSMAELFVFPSLYEGFGIPILEAQQCGIPVITSNISAMPEVAGKGALYINPYDIESIENSISEILNNKELADKLIEEGYRNVKKFSWDKSSNKMNEIIENIIMEG